MPWSVFYCQNLIGTAQQAWRMDQQTHKQCYGTYCFSWKAELESLLTYLEIWGKTIITSAITGKTSITSATLLALVCELGTGIVRAPEHCNRCRLWDDPWKFLLYLHGSFEKMAWSAQWVSNQGASV